ncbi:hypothetical protein GC105_16275 [Alkalibaculum sp. M08DMB]|uniref:Uncharacterized protein n=1 Tax=Alkalibaculum sporogenes TaxID=2655001 RepID=A0A6A7KEB9_9FIRM|nr:hypothetical protein [Alkalibaculum sporogenes]MPW27323.1 hypothetical protein [Alkalibaculum sporogenes]
MFAFTLIFLMVLAVLLMIITEILYKKRKEININLLLTPYFFFFLLILLFGNDNGVMEIYLNKQIFTLSLGFFSMHVMVTIININRMMKGYSKKE